LLINQEKTMNEFVFLYLGGMSSEAQPSPEQMQQQMTRWQNWLGKLSQDGTLKDFGAPLQREAKRVASGGVVTDGPFSDGKEIIGGYSIVRAKDLAHAAEIAKGCPVFEAGGSVEVRAVAPM
jgi:hypothetical protein